MWRGEEEVSEEKGKADVKKTAFRSLLLGRAGQFKA